METARQTWKLKSSLPAEAFFQIQHFPKIFRARGWPEIGIWTPRNHTRAWKECLPDHKLPAPLPRELNLHGYSRASRVLPAELQLAMPGCGTFSQAAVRCDLHYRKWIKTIPDEVLREVRRYGLHAYRVLKIFSLSHPAGLELSCSGGHVLMLGLADQLRQNRFELRKMGSLPKCSRREIADYLGLPATKSAIRILAKIQLEDVAGDDSFFHSLERLFKSQPASLRARHLSRISGETLSILTTPRLLAACSMELLDATAGPTEFPFDIRGTLSDTLRMWREIRRDHAVPVIQSERHLHELHNELTEAFNAFSQERHMRYLRQLRFPKPPLPGNQAIVPITTATELLKEGQDCHHCIGSFYQEVADGECYVYRILAPERATLMLSPSKRGAWRVSEVKAPCNRAIRPETQKMIEDWLAGEVCAPAP